MPRTVMEENKIEWYDRFICANKVFLEYEIDSNTLIIYNKDVYDERRNFVINTELEEKYNHAFLKDWYPDFGNCSNSLKDIINDIIYARYDRFNKIIQHPTPSRNDWYHDIYRYFSYQLKE